MRVDAIQTSFVRALGPELGMRMGQAFSDPAQGQQQLQALFALISTSFPKAGLRPAAEQLRPQPFSPVAAGQLPRNPMASLTQLQGQRGTAAGNSLQDLLRMLDEMVALLSGQQPGASAAAPAAGHRAAPAQVAPTGQSFAADPAGGSEVRVTQGGGGWGNIDSMMAQAEQLMQSDKQSDQLKGQMLMMKAMRLFEMVSKMMEQQSQLASKAIQAIR